MSEVTLSATSSQHTNYSVDGGHNLRLYLRGFRLYLKWPHRIGVKESLPLDAALLGT